MTGQLTPSEREIARLYATGHTRHDIAELQGIQPHSVTCILCRACRKLGVPTKRGERIDGQLVAVAITGGSVPEREPPLSDAMKAYLRVFDRYLKTWARGSLEEERRAGLECRYMLGAIYLEQGITRSLAA